MLNKNEKEQRLAVFLSAAALITVGRAFAGAPFNAKKITKDASDLTDEVIGEIKHLERNP